ncbi:glutathione S-transferase family protein, partial [Mycobacterium kansasii]
EKAIEEAVELLKILDNELQGKKFFGGETIGLADISANFIGLWLGIYQEMLGIQVLTSEKLPRLSEWANEYLNSTIIKQSLPPRDELSA